MTEEETAHVLALEHAFAVLAQALSEKGVLPKDDLREKLRAAGSSLVMTSALPLAKKSGHELARIADRLL